MRGKVKSFSQGVVIGGVILTALLSSMGYAVKAGNNDVKIGGNGYQCLGDREFRWKTENSSTSNLPIGYAVESVVVKAGQDCIPVYPTKNDCYTVLINGQTITVTKVDSKSCKNAKDISHLEGTYTIYSPSPSVSVSPSIPASANPSEEPCPSDTPIPSDSTAPTASASSKPHDEASPTPSTSAVASPEASPSTAASATPTPSASYTATPSPSNNNSNNTNNSSGSSNNNSSGSVAGASTTQGEVLGAYAGTGVVQDVMMNALGSLGGLMTLGGSVLYGKKKRS